MHVDVDLHVVELADRTLIDQAAGAGVVGGEAELEVDRRGQLLPAAEVANLARMLEILAHRLLDKRPGFGGQGVDDPGYGGCRGGDVENRVLLHRRLDRLCERAVHAGNPEGCGPASRRSPGLCRKPLLPENLLSGMLANGRRA